MKMNLKNMIWTKMELEIAYKEGLAITLSEIIMEKYHKDVKDWLMDCSEKEIPEIYALVGNDVPYKSILEAYA